MKLELYFKNEIIIKIIVKQTESWMETEIVSLLLTLSELISNYAQDIMIPFYMPDLQCIQCLVIPWILIFNFFTVYCWRV